MNKQEIITKVKTLNLPNNQYVVFGSCPLAAAGLREAQDIDLFVSKAVLAKLKESGWQELYKSANDKPLVYDVFEAHDNWNFSSYSPTLEQLLLTATRIDGIPFVSLEEVIKWKISSGRPKDLADVELIKKFELFPKSQLKSTTLEEFSHTNLPDLKALVVELTDTLKILEPELGAVGKDIEDSYTQMLIDGIQKEQGKIWFAKQAGKIVGFAAVQVKQDEDEALQHLYVSDLVVTASQRGKGLGRMLLEKCEEYAHELGIKYVRIGSLVSNPGAAKLYERYGFTPQLVVYQKKID